MHSESNTLQVPLSRGKMALIDAADYEWLSQWRWYAVRAGRPGGPPLWYARRSHDKIYMHRLLMGLSTPGQVDHANHDGLDNRRENLRYATSTKNGANARAPRHNTSGYRGVSRHRACGQWQATISVAGTQHWLGCFATSEEAAQAYDVAAVQWFGEFATLNGVHAD